MSANRDPKDKILPREALVRAYGRRGEEPRQARLVFTNGCFDLLHRGHVEYLRQARALGDALVVGVNTDASVERLKGPGRPVMPEGDRAVVLAGLESVDVVTLFPEDTPQELIAALVPDVLVKGGDYEISQVVGREVVEAAGGEVKLIPYLPGQSTTDLLHSIRAMVSGPPAPSPTPPRGTD
jgi:D-beta-D-heptose 7-phosphate kinase/D-beta-D-heptose 1-phosphate adenosyltransferase